MRWEPARVVFGAALLCSAVPVRADVELDRLEERLIALEAELATTARSVALSVTPDDATATINGTVLGDGASVAVLPGSLIEIVATDDRFKALAVELGPIAAQQQIAVTLCPATRTESYEYQPPDEVTQTAVGNAEVRFSEQCPADNEAQRELADRACATDYEGASRDPAKSFNLRREFGSGTCLITAECITRTTVTPDRVIRQRDVPNDACESTAVLE